VERGFSLVEMMVALAILGLLTGAILMTLPPQGPRASDEAEALAARLEHAREAALTANRSVEVTLEADGLGFREQRRGQWVPLAEGPFKPRPWPQGLAVAVESDGGRAVRFDSTGAAEPATVRLSNGRSTTRVVVDAQGEVQVHDAAR
jgi:general secretion pathway protein H